MGQEVCVVDLRDGGEKGSLNPLGLAVRCGTDAGAVARSSAAEIIERAPDVAVLHEHRLRGLRSPRLAAIEPTIPQGALGSPLTAIFALVLARASYRSEPGSDLSSQSNQVSKLSFLSKF
jgi:hypothetical protein